MQARQSILAGAVAAALALAATAPAQAADEAKDKCYGIAKAGQNDCAGNGHACSGQSKKDNDKSDWKYVAKGSCEKMGGSMKPGK